MGFIWKDIDSHKYCFQSCSNCGLVIETIPVDSVAIPELVEYMCNNKWQSVEPSKENGYQFLTYCSKCSMELLNKKAAA